MSCHPRQALQSRGQLALRPKVRPQFPAGDQMAKRQAFTVDGDSQFRPAVVDPIHVKIIEGPIHAGRVDLAFLGEDRDTESGGEADFHGFKSRSFCETSKLESRLFCGIATPVGDPDTCTMDNPEIEDLLDPWEQRAFVVGLIDKKLEEGWSYEDLAKALKLRGTRSLENDWRYDKRRIPGRHSVTRLAEFFDLPETSIYKPRVDPDQARFELARAIISTAMGDGAIETLSREQILNAAEVALATVKSVLTK